MRRRLLLTLVLLMCSLSLGIVGSLNTSMSRENNFYFTLAGICLSFSCGVWLGKFITEKK